MRLIAAHGAPVFVIGTPLSHTLSPLIHNVAFETAALPHRYFALQVQPDELSRFVDIIRQLDSPGANLTLPHKEKICSIISDRDPEVEQLGAANTIYNHAGKLRLANTDIYGFSRLLEPWLHKVRDSGVLVLGAGGAARACLVALQQLNCQQIFLWNRTPEKALKLAKELGGSSLQTLGDSALQSGQFAAAVVVNATSVGLQEPEPEIFPQKLIQPGMVGIDLIYNRSTKFLQNFQQCGAENSDGLAMLVYQAARSWQLWTGQKPPIKAMFKAINDRVKES